MRATFCVYIFYFHQIVFAFTTLQLSSLEEMFDFNNNHTYVRNVTGLLEKLNNVIQMGPNSLVIITDYDETLTVDPGDNRNSGKRILNSFVMLRLCPSIPQTYKDADANLADYYLSIVSNPSTSIEERTKHMTEWYTTRIYGLLKGNKLPRDELNEIAHNASLGSFREGVNRVISWSELNNVPLMILSAGLGDAVNATLDTNNLLFPNVQIISNFLDVDHDDIIIGLKRKLIHNYNKKDIINTSEYSEIIGGRKNVILMGDGIWDSNMTDRIAFDNSIKIGFLNSEKTRYLQTYLESFDIVLVNDQTMDIVNVILNQIR